MSRAADMRRRLEADELQWLAHLHPRTSRRFHRTAPRRQLLDALIALPVGARPHEPAQLVVEQGRSLGKTEQGRAWLLERALTRRELGAVICSERAEDAHAWASSLMAILPPRRAKGPERILWRKTPMGSLYPNLGWSGGVQLLLLHLDRGGVFPIWTRGAGGQIRGLNLDGIRPTLFIADDIITSASGYSSARTDARIRLLDDEAVGLGPGLEQPVTRIAFVNAICANDMGERLRAAGWASCTGSVWRDAAGRDVTGLPLSDALKRCLTLLAGGDTPEPALLADALQGHQPSDPDHDPVSLLRKEALLGSAVFNRAFCCARLADAAALWPWDDVQSYEPRSRDFQTIGIWLDPRYSEDKDRNDFAAVAAVGLLPDGRSVILAADGRRCELAEQRALLWEAVDRMHAAYAAPIAVGYETNAIGAFLARDFKADIARRQAEGRHVPLMRGFPSTARKAGPERLERLVSPIQTARLLVAPGALSPEAVRQCRELGTGYHDDIPDAIERADARARGLT